MLAGAVIYAQRLSSHHFTLGRVHENQGQPGIDHLGKHEKLVLYVVVSQKRDENSKTDHQKPVNLVLIVCCYGVATTEIHHDC